MKMFSKCKITNVSKIIVGTSFLSLINFGICNADSSKLFPDVPAVKIRDAAIKFVVYKYNIEYDVNGLAGPLVRSQVCKKDAFIPVYDVRNATKGGTLTVSNCETKLNDKKGSVEIGALIEIQNANPFADTTSTTYKVFKAQQSFVEEIQPIPDPDPIPKHNFLNSNPIGGIYYGFGHFSQGNVQTKDLKIQSVGIDLGAPDELVIYGKMDIPIPSPRFENNTNVKFCNDVYPGPIFPCQTEHIVGFVEFNDNVPKLNK